MTEPTNKEIRERHDEVALYFQSDTHDHPMSVQARKDRGLLLKRLEAAEAKLEAVDMQKSVAVDALESAVRQRDKAEATIKDICETIDNIEKCTIAGCGCENRMLARIKAIINRNDDENI